MNTQQIVAVAWMAVSLGALLASWGRERKAAIFGWSDLIAWLIQLFVIMYVAGLFWSQ